MNRINIEYIPLFELGEIITGKTPSTEKKEYWDGDVPFITPSDIDGYSMRYIYETERTISKKGVDSQKKTLLPKNAICISCIASIGKMCLTSKPSITNQQINSIIPKPNYDYRYLFYALRFFSPYLQLIGGGTGSGTPIISKNIDVEQRIADILSNYDSLLELNAKRIAILEQMSNDLFIEWFVRFRFPGCSKNDIINGVPKEWVYLPVQELCSVLRRGISPEYDDEGLYTVISQKCIRGNVMDIRESRQQTKEYNPELNIRDGDTVICSTGTGTLGRVGKVIGCYDKTTFDSHVTLARAKENIGKHFLYGSLKNMQTWFMNMGIGSTNQQELYISTIRNAKILVPSDTDLLNRFERTIDPIHNEIGNLLKQNEILSKQRDYLLPRLMSGKLEV